MTSTTDTDLTETDHYVDLWVARNNLDLMDEFMDNEEAEGCVDCWIDDELAIVHEAYNTFAWDPETEMEPDGAPAELVHRGFGLMMFHHAVEGFFCTRENDGTNGLLIQHLKRAVLDSEDAILAITGESCVHSAEETFREGAETAQPAHTAEADQAEVDRRFLHLVKDLKY